MAGNSGELLYSTSLRDMAYKRRWFYYLILACISYTLHISVYRENGEHSAIANNNCEEVLIDI